MGCACFKDDEKILLRIKQQHHRFTHHIQFVQAGCPQASPKTDSGSREAPTHMPAFLMELRVQTVCRMENLLEGISLLDNIERFFSCVRGEIHKNPSECAMINFTWHSGAKGHKHVDSYMSIQSRFRKVQLHIWSKWSSSGAFSQLYEPSVTLMTIQTGRFYSLFDIFISRRVLPGIG